MKRFHSKVLNTDLAGHLRTRFPHPFVRSFEGTSSVGIKGAVKYFQHLGNGYLNENTPKDTVAEILVKKLISSNVKFVFGIIGDVIHPIIEAVRKHEDKIELISVRHEESAAFMACGYAKYTGRLGVCLATSGPGTMHLLNGLYDANKDHVPVLAITGGQSSHLGVTDYTQEINVISLMEDVSLYNHQINGSSQVDTVVDRAIKAATDGAGVAHLNIPRDIQQEHSTLEKHRGGLHLSTVTPASAMRK